MAFVVGLPVPIHSLGRDLRPVVGAGRRQPLAIGRVADEEFAQRRPLAIPRFDQPLVDDEPQRLRARDHRIFELGGRKKARDALHGQRHGFRVDRRRRRVARDRRLDGRDHVFGLAALADDDVGRLAAHRPRHEAKLFTLRGISLCEMVLVTLWTRSSRNSTGSAHSMMLRWASGSRSFSTVIAPIRVDLPDPVAPETIIMPLVIR
jgi:hypothetical protein